VVAFWNKASVQRNDLKLKDLNKTGPGICRSLYIAR